MNRFILSLRARARALPIALAITLLLAPQIHAAEVPGVDSVSTVLTLEEFIAIGLRDNPAIKAKRLAWQSTARRSPQARAFDDPMLTYTEAISEIETRLGPNRRSIMLSQKLPYPGKRRIRGLVADKEAQITRVALEKATRDLVLDIKKVYFDLYYLDKALELAKERIEVFEHFSKAEMNDYSVGVTNFSDVVSAQTRYADAEYDLILFEELRGAAVSRMNALLNRGPEEQIASVVDPVIDENPDELEALYLLAGGNEDVKEAELQIEKNSLKEELAKFKSRPNFMVGLKFTDVGDPEIAGLKDGGRDAVAVTVGLSLPIWGAKNRAAIDEARLRRVASERAKMAVSDGLNAKVKSAYADMRSNFQLVRLYSGSLIPKARKLIDTVRIMYKNGKGSIADVFEARVMLINFSLAHHRAASNYLKNRAELERLTAVFALKEVASDE